MQGVIYHIYKLEHRLDIYDKHIDHTTLKKCFSYDKESYVVDCYLEVRRSSLPENLQRDWANLADSMPMP